MSNKKDSTEFLLKLLDITRELTQTIQTEALLARILDAAIEVTQAERGFLCLKEEGELSIRVARNLDQEAVQNAREKLSQSVIQKVMTTGEPLISLDAGEDTRLTASQSIQDMRVRSVACTPLKIIRKSQKFQVQEGEVETIGCVYLDHRFQSAQFHDKDLEALEIFGAHAAMAIENAELLARLEEQNRQLNDQLSVSSSALQEARSLLEDAAGDDTAHHDVPGIIYASRAMHEVLGLVKCVAPKDLPILITGESGTGKELLARAIHQLSAHAGGDFIAVNCGAIPSELFESELFGHKRGAFTGADRDRQGLIEAADGGTLFLDEVSELPLQHQVKLLRALQEGEIRRVGEERVRPVNFRVLSACNKDLAIEVEGGRFREDLFYRLRVFHVELPPLRARTEDIPLLIDRLVEKFSDQTGTGKSAQVPISPEAYSKLANYSWPGNVRELENEVRRALALTDSQIEPRHLSPQIVQAPAKTGAFAPFEDTGRSLEEILSTVERKVIRKTLEEFGGNKSKVAEELQISRNGLAIKMRRLGLS